MHEKSRRIYTVANVFTPDIPVTIYTTSCIYKQKFTLVQCQQGNASRAMPAGQCQQGNASKAMPAGQCQQGNASRAVSAGQCQQGNASRAMPAAAHTAFVIVGSRHYFVTSPLKNETRYKW